VRTPSGSHSSERVMRRENDIRIDLRHMGCKTGDWLRIILLYSEQEMKMKRNMA
jgi:S-ribosylhomocysteine lyase LuxS involved in autoinducer biosynthesis